MNSISNSFHIHCNVNLKEKETERMRKRKRKEKTRNLLFLSFYLCLYLVLLLTNCLLLNLINIRSLISLLWFRNFYSSSFIYSFNLRNLLILYVLTYEINLKKFIHKFYNKNAACIFSKNFACIFLIQII